MHSPGLRVHPSRLSFSRSYGVILPSSLTRVLPIALVFSTHPPVSVFGTVTRNSLEAFLGSLGSTTSGLLGPAITPQTPDADFPTSINALQVWHLNPITGWPTLLRHPFAQTSLRGTGILTRCPSPTAFALGLGPTNPTRINLASETSDLRRICFSHTSRYSCQHSHF
jgi:hypothetical protein